MNLDEYQQISLKGLAIKDKSVAALAHRSLGLSGEAGTLANHIKKTIRDNNGVLSEADRRVVKEKLGDSLYYLVALADFADISLEEIMQANADKTQKFIKSKGL
jgi:NTP pyrophosphatase (non-canonical NTP hydrolase)